MIYGLTLLWLSRYVTERKAILSATFKGAFIGAVLELSGIILQVLRGTTSHFNTSTEFDAAVWMTIRVAIFPVAFALVVLFVKLLKEKELPPVLGAAIRWGLVLTMVGIIPGVLMMLPDHMQNALTNHKQFDGHTIGYREGGPGLQFLGWSSVAGDLRPAHFFGLHALQVLPLIGYVISVVFAGASIDRQKQLVRIAGFTYLGFDILLTVQALYGESIIRPSIHTLVLCLLLAVSSFVSVIYTLWPDRRQLQSRRPLPSGVSANIRVLTSL